MPPLVLVCKLSLFLLLVKHLLTEQPDSLETTTKSMDFRMGTTHVAFGLFVAWIYTQKVDIDYKEDLARQFSASSQEISDQSRNFYKKVNSAVEVYFEQLVDLWFLAEKLCIPALQNATIDAIEELRYDTVFYLPASICSKIWEATNKDHPLRQYATLTVWVGFSDCSDEFIQNLPEDMLRFLMGRLRYESKSTLGVLKHSTKDFYVPNLGKHRSTVRTQDVDNRRTRADLSFGNIILNSR